MSRPVSRAGDRCPRLLLMQGLPAAGKSTLARKLIANASGPVRYVGLDGLRLMLDGQAPSAWWADGVEESTARAQAALVGQLLADGATVLVDGTHVTPWQLVPLREVVDGWLLDVVVHRVGTPADVCVARDLERAHPIGGVCIGWLAGEWAAAEAGGWRLTGEWLTGVPNEAVSTMMNRSPASLAHAPSPVNGPREAARSPLGAPEPSRLDPSGHRGVR